MIISVVVMSIKTITYFLNGLFVVIFFFDLTGPDLLTISLTLMTFLVESFGKVS